MSKISKLTSHIPLKEKEKKNLSMTMINFFLFTLQERQHEVWRPIVKGTKHVVGTVPVQ